VTQSVDTAGKVTATAYNDSGGAIDVTVDIGANGEG